MPVTVRRRGNVKSRPWAIVETATGRIKGRSRTRRDAEASARIRNRVHGEKLSRGRRTRP